MASPCCIKFLCFKGKAEAAKTQDKEKKVEEGEWFEPIRRKSTKQRQVSADVDIPRDEGDDADATLDDLMPGLGDDKTILPKSRMQQQVSVNNAPGDHGNGDTTLEALRHVGIGAKTKSDPRATFRARSVSEPRLSVSSPRLSVSSNAFAESIDKPLPPLFETRDALSNDKPSVSSDAFAKSIDKPQPPFPETRDALSTDKPQPPLDPETRDRDALSTPGTGAMTSSDICRKLLSDLSQASSDVFRKSMDNESEIVPLPNATSHPITPRTGATKSTSSEIGERAAAARLSSFSSDFSQDSLSCNDNDGKDNNSCASAPTAASPLEKQDRIREIRERARARRAAAAAQSSSISSDFSQDSLSCNDNGGMDNPATASPSPRVRKNGRSKGGHSLRGSLLKMSLKKKN